MYTGRSYLDLSQQRVLALSFNLNVITDNAQLECMRLRNNINTILSSEN